MFISKSKQKKNTEREKRRKGENDQDCHLSAIELNWSFKKTREKINKSSIEIINLLSNDYAKQFSSILQN